MTQNQKLTLNLTLGMCKCANDIILAVTYVSHSSCGSEELETANDAFDASNLFITTESGQITANKTNWRKAQHRSWW